MQRWFVVSCLTFFILAGCIFIPRLGIQSDEALAASALYPTACGPPRAQVKVLGTNIPLMLMTYVGAFKAWLYSMIFIWVRPSVWPVRLPMLLAAAAAAGTYVVTARRYLSAGQSAAMSALLLTDPVYLLTSVFDWGPVALQHLFVSFGVWHFLRFLSSGSDLSLALAGFAAGLSVWNKTIAVWTIFAVVVAGAMVFSRELTQVHLTRRRVFLALGACVLGAAPLLYYNAVNPLVTVRENVSLQPVPLWKIAWTMDSLDGVSLFGFLVPGNDAAPGDSFYTSKDSSFPPRRGLTTLLLLLSVASLPFLARSERRVCVFAVLAFLIAWSVMSFSGGGGSAHHVVLLSPLPQLIIAVALGAVGSRSSRLRWVVAGLLVLACVSNILLIGRYYVAASRSGGARGWSDAILGLAQERARYPAERVYLADWGIRGGACLLDPGVKYISISQDSTVQELTAIARDDNAIVIRTLAGNQFFPEIFARLSQVAETEGRRASRLAIVKNSHGVPAFELLRWTSSTPPNRLP